MTLVKRLLVRTSGLDLLRWAQKAVAPWQKKGHTKVTELRIQYSLGIRTTWGEEKLVGIKVGTVVWMSFHPGS